MNKYRKMFVEDNLSHIYIEAINMINVLLGLSIFILGLIHLSFIAFMPLLFYFIASIFNYFYLYKWAQNKNIEVQNKSSKFFWLASSYIIAFVLSYFIKNIVSCFTNTNWLFKKEKEEKQQETYRG